MAFLLGFNTRFFLKIFLERCRRISVRVSLGIPLERFFTIPSGILLGISPRDLPETSTGVSTGVIPGLYTRTPGRIFKRFL